MDQWQQLFQEFVTGVAQDVEQLVETVVDTVDALANLAEETVVEAQKLAVSELERTFPFLRDDVFWTEFWDFDDSEDFHSSLSSSIYGVEPMTEQPQACQGCLHFHGHSYNGTPFVCAMHPYGPESETCGDWSGS
jgi:hypothetical protein